jgi:CheY-like chemotaxis protein
MRSHDLSGVRVLVVEDDADCRALFTVILEIEGAIVATAGTAWEGLKRIGQFVPDVIVTDLGLPDEDGCWLIRGARAAVGSGVRVPPIAIVTANDEPFVRRRCLLAGCDAFLTKPVDASDLCAAVRRLAAEGAAAGPGVCAAR